jgi:membrane protein
VSAVKNLVRRLDDYQQSHPWLGFPLAVAKKFGDDQGGYLAALVAYYGFFSLFPLLLVFVTILGFALGGNPQLTDKVVNSVLVQFPVIGDQIQSNVHSLKGSGFALAVGIAGSLYGGLGVIQAMQNGMDKVWNVPVKEKPSFVASRLRALVMLAVLGVASLGATALSGVATAGGSFGPVLKAVSLAASLALNFGIFLVAFRVLTVAKVGWGDVVPGAAVAAVVWGILQSLGNYYVGHQLKGASQTYGLFAIVIGLLSWLYLGAQVTLMAAEINVAKARRLWPRSLQPPLTGAEERALADQAKEQERRPEERVDVSFHEATGEGGESSEAADEGNEGSADDGDARRPRAAIGGQKTGAQESHAPVASDSRPDEPSISDLLSRVVGETTTLIRQELTLAGTEIAAKAGQAGMGAGLVGAAGIVAVLAVLAMTAAFVLLLATVLPAWVAGLAVAAVYGFVGGLLVLRGRKKVEEAAPPVPEHAIAAIKTTREMVQQAWEAGASPVEEAPEATPLPIPAPSQPERQPIRDALPWRRDPPRF